jgi:MoaA/NifB/PqqE/SkfB family radical SAM enzyme
MSPRAFTDTWSGLHVYDPDWRLIDAQDALRDLARYEGACVESGTLPDGPLSAPLRAVLEVTRACNLDCAFCYNSSGAVANMLSDEELLAVVQQLCELPVLEVVLTGGEVLTAPERLEAVVRLLAANGVAFHVITNGWLMTPDWASFLADRGVYSVQVSVDGAEPVMHDSLRRREGSWRRAVAAVGHLERAGCFTIMAAVATRQNCRALSEYIDFAFCLGANQVLVGDLIPRGRAIATQDDLRMSDHQYDDVLEMMRAKSREYAGLMLINVGTDEAMSLKLQISKRSDGILIRGDGSVTPGCMLPMPLGNVRAQSLREIWRGAFADIRANTEIMSFLNELQVTGVGERSLLRVVHGAQTPDP